MVEFNRECDKYADAIAEAAPAQAAAGTRDTAAIDRLFHAADWLAMHFQRRVLLAMRLTYTLAALMGIAFTFYAHMPAQNFLIYLFLFLFASGGAVAALARYRGWHRKYLDYRALAEGLRIQSYWRRAGVSANADHEFAHDNFLQKQNIELGWIRNVMRAASLDGSDSKSPSDAQLATVVADWVGEPGRGGQLDYYARKTAHRSRMHRLTRRLGLVCLAVSVAIGVFLALFQRQLDSGTTNLLVSAMGVLAIVAAARESYAYRKGDKELSKQYRYMFDIFANARKQLEATQDPLSQREILRELGEAALAEHSEWALMHRERPLESARF